MNKFDVATPEYRALLQQRYESPGWGGSGHSHWPEVREFAVKLKAQSVLDYGCGRGTLKRAIDDAFMSGMPGVRFDVREYDPGIIGKDELPEPADLLVSTDVLEHIEPLLLDGVLQHMQSLALKGMYLIIATGPAREVLPDGRNAHLIQQPITWWAAKLKEHKFAVSRVEKRKGVNVWVTK